MGLGLTLSLISLTCRYFTQWQNKTSELPSQRISVLSVIIICGQVFVFKRERGYNVLRIALTNSTNGSISHHVQVVSSNKNKSKKEVEILARKIGRRSKFKYCLYNHQYIPPSCSNTCLFNMSSLKGFNRMHKTISCWF